MRVLIVPMSSMAETSGTNNRTAILAQDLKKAGIDAALCAAEDLNYKPIEGIQNYFLSPSSPLGFPQKIAPYVFPAAQKLGVTSKKWVNSFEDVLHLTGNTDYNYLKTSIGEIRKAIRDFHPDVIYSEFNISAIVAGRLENRKIFITASLPTQYEYSSASKYASGLNKILRKYELPEVTSCLELFSWADQKFVPSCQELEPFQNTTVEFCGTWKHMVPVFAKNRNKIIVYMGSGTISQKKMINVITSSFRDSTYQVYIAGRGLPVTSMENFHFAPYFDFLRLLPEAALFVNHGGQNSVIDGLIYGVPQILCPGRVFERMYNAESIVKNGAGLQVSSEEFSAKAVLSCADEILSDMQYPQNAFKLGDILLSLGGTKKIIDALDSVSA